MRWSQVKSQLESNFAERVRGRVKLHTTRYRKAHDQMGRSWIELDGVEIWSWPSAIATPHGAETYGDLSVAHEMPVAARAFLQMSIDDALSSPVAFVRFLAVLDRRLGSRRIGRVANVEANPLVIRALELRESRSTRSEREMGSLPL